MKKFLLSLAAVALSAGYAVAQTETVTFDFKNETYGLTRLSGTTSDYIDEGTIISQDPISITFKTANAAAKNESGCRLWSDGIRMYNGGTMEISCPDGYLLKNISTTCTATNLTSKAGTGNAVIFNKNNPWFSTAGAQEVTIAYTATSKNTPVADLTIEYEKTAASDKEPAGLSFPAASFTVGIGEPFNKGILSNPNELPVTWTSSDEAVATVTEEGNILVKGVGTTVITATSEETEKFMAGKASYTLTVVAAAANIADMLKYAPAKGDKVLVTGALTVAYSNGKYTYVTDIWEDATLLYDNAGTTVYQKGDQLPGGWEATNSLYNGLIEWTGTFPQATACYPDFVEYATLTEVTEDDINKVVWINGIDFTDATPAKNTNVTVTLPDGQEIVVLNAFGIESMAAGKYNVLCAVAIYNSTLQLYPIEYVTATESNDPDFPASIEIITDGDQVVVSQQYDEEEGQLLVILAGVTNKQTLEVTLATPEGWDGYIGGVMEGYGATLRAADDDEDPVWVPVEAFLSMGMSKTNTLTFKVDREGNGGMAGLYLYKGEEVYVAKNIFVSNGVKYDDPTGVAAIETEEEATYYNLQGVKVENPAEGIYVKVANGKAVKVVL